jgi:hypothetical protein
MGSTPQRVRIKGEEHVVSADDIVAVTKREAPRRINAYFVEIDGRRFPPKQLLRGALPSAPPFDTGVAVRCLESLGFQVVRLEEP